MEKMCDQIQIIVKELDGKKETIRETIIEEISISTPKSVSEFGLNQAHQLKLLEKLETPLMNAQSELLNVRPSKCPQCGSSVSKNGKSHSNFHHVYSDHQVSLQKYKCSKAGCDWSYTPSIREVLGGKMHSDLIKLHSE